MNGEVNKFGDNPTTVFNVTGNKYNKSDDVFSSDKKSSKLNLVLGATTNE